MNKRPLVPVLFVALGLCAAPPLRAQDKTAAAPSFQETLKTRRVDVNFAATPLHDVAAFLARLAQTNIVLDPAVRRERLITLALEDVRLETALTVLVGRSLAWQARDNVIVIVNRHPAAGMPVRPPAEDEQKLSELLKTTRVDVNFEATPLADVVNFLRALTKLNIVLDPDIEDRSIGQRLVTLTLRQTCLDDALGLVAGQDMACHLVDNVVVIRERSPRTVAAGPQPADSEARVRNRLQTRRTSVEHKGEPLSEVVAQLAAVADIPIVFDPAILDWEEVKERPVILAMKNASLGTILEVLIGKDLVWVVKGEAVVITRK